MFTLIFDLDGIRNQQQKNSHKYDGAVCKAGNNDDNIVFYSQSDIAAVGC